MRPIQVDIVGHGGHIAQPDTEVGAVFWVDRLVAPIGRRYRERVRHCGILLEIAGAGLQEQEGPADFEVGPRVRYAADDGFDGESLAGVQRGGWWQRKRG